jgi:hypothetical protein
VAVKGFLIEDTSLLEIQYKRQLNAIKNYENDNITNSQLRKYLFQPENLKQLADDVGELDTEFNVISTEKNGKPVQFQEAQKFAILKSSIQATNYPDTRSSWYWQNNSNYRTYKTDTCKG